MNSSLNSVSTCLKVVDTRRDVEDGIKLCNLHKVPDLVS